VDPQEPVEQPASTAEQSNPDPVEQPSRKPKSRATAQMQHLRAEFGDLVEPGPMDWERLGIEFLARRGFVVARDQDAETVRGVLRAADLLFTGDEEPARDGSPTNRMVAYGIQWIRLARGVSSIEAAEFVNSRHPGMANVEHLLHSTETGGSCPADEPVPAPAGTPPDPPVSTDRFAGAGIKVVVVDTGFYRKAAALPWLRGVRGQRDLGIGQPLLQPYAGHGTFIAGVVRSMAPRAEVYVRRSLAPAAAAFEKELVDDLTKVLERDRPDVISLSAGTRTFLPVGLSVLDGFYEQVLRKHKGLVVVAAAGNDRSRAPFWPAAAPWTVSVGALASDWRSRARFSNYGGWVDVYAPGQHLVNAFPVGRFQYQEPKRFGKWARFKGMAIWSGTSFSTPLVAGLIAARMSRTGENGHAAAAALIAQAHAGAIPGLGAVLLPEQQSG
jgi:subtilisin family serine protease